jgi:hypothetical protein
MYIQHVNVSALICLHSSYVSLVDEDETTVMISSDEEEPMQSQGQEQRY